jgi:hypothetical protein
VEVWRLTESVPIGTVRPSCFAATAYECKVTLFGVNVKAESELAYYVVLQRLTEWIGAALRAIVNQRLTD